MDISSVLSNISMKSSESEYTGGLGEILLIPI